MSIKSLINEKINSVVDNALLQLTTTAAKAIPSWIEKDGNGIITDYKSFARMFRFNEEDIKRIIDCDASVEMSRYDWMRLDVILTNISFLDINMNDTKEEKNYSQYMNEHIAKMEASEFIDNVNKNLEKKEKIDKKEALEAKETFDKDVDDRKKRVDRISKSIMKRIFCSDKPLEDRTIGELKYLIYKNHWNHEVDNDLKDNRLVIIPFLYGKLSEEVIRQLDINNINKEIVKETEEEPAEEKEFEIEIDVDDKGKPSNANDNSKFKKEEFDDDDEDYAEEWDDDEDGGEKINIQIINTPGFNEALSNLIDCLGEFSKDNGNK